MTQFTQVQRLDALIVMLGRARNAAEAQCFFASRDGYLATKEIERFLEIDLTDALADIAYSGGFTCDELDAEPVPQPRTNPITDCIARHITSARSGLKREWAA